MNILKNTFLAIISGILLSGCAATAQKVNNNNAAPLSSKIIYAPVIDIPYSEVSANIEKNIGTDVRWGGKVIDSEIVDESTVRLTVFAYPLSDEGRPVKNTNDTSESGRFIVDLTEGFVQGVNFKEHYVTFYGGVASSLTVTNGNRNKAIPIITAEELVDWNVVDESKQYGDDRRGNAYYSLGYRRGHLGYGSRYPYYGRSYYGSGGRYSSFGYYSRGSSYHRRGFGGSRYRRY